MRFILEGDPKEVAKVIQENRIRVERGVIRFTPAQPDAALPEDDKTAPPITPKATLKRTKKSE